MRTVEQPAKAWPDRHETYRHIGCSGEMEWYDDFTVNGRKYIIHKCTVCGQKDQRSYDPKNYMGR